jgi:alpha-beta hydrolase superfamily lysophospholipase
LQSSEFQQRLAGGYHALMRRWLPESRPRAVVQIIHGMAEHSGRYARLAEALTGAGYAVYAHDLPGHGPQVAPEARGHFADRRGWRLAVATIRDAQRLAQQEQPKLPLFMLGHSLGSFLLQHYVADFGETLAGAVLSATTGEFGPMRRVGLALVRTEALLYGRRHQSAVGEFISFKNFNKPFNQRGRPARTDFDWLSRDPAEVDRYVADPCCGFRCTTGTWLDLLECVGKLTEPARLRRIPKSLPVLMIAGSDDPVCGGAKGPRTLERCYRSAGLRDVYTRIYPQGRHELFNDTCRDEVIAELIAWIKNHLPAAK